MRRKIWNSQRGQLIYLDRNADENFWDEQWNRQIKKIFASPPRARSIVKITRRWLKPQSRILEGGCGMAQFVYALDLAGFQVTGVDFAPQVVAAVNQYWPHLDVQIGDVRDLPVNNDSIDGYWSFGVIEHFAEGFDPIVKEMHRVIRLGGFLFLTFPMLNQFRLKRAHAGKYGQTNIDATEMREFYQYALNPESVIRKLSSSGFELRSKLGQNSLQGLGEDIFIIRKLDKLLEERHPRFRIGLGMFLDKLFGNYAGHSALLVFQKTK